MKEFTLEESVVIGSNGYCTVTDTDISKPLVIRGVVKKEQMRACEKIGRDFYYIDTGYVGNFPSPGNLVGKKLWHRIVKNSLQHSELRDVPGDRWDNLIKQDPRLQFKCQKHFDKKILLVLPNPKATKFFDVDYDTWVTETTEQIKKYSNLPIEVRVKGSRVDRNHGYSIYDAFNSGVYATVAFNSIAALESVLYGIPAFVSVPCAASPLANTDLSKLSSPFFPDKDLIQKQCNNIAYGQFNLEEITNGTAWKILKKYESNS
jgi:hypothetical protein